ncbi:MAG: UPF0158 family protein [Nitrospirota bacterium]
MKKLAFDFDEIQKAMEDTARDAFEYFLDINTGDVIILSNDIINRAHQILGESYDEDMIDYEEVEFDEDHEIPEWVEDEVELALDIFINKKERYIRIPERNPRNGYAAMREFAETLDDVKLKENLLKILDGKGAFRKFKDALESFPKERKLWYGFNAKASRKEIEEWLGSIGAGGKNNQQS